MHQKDLHVLIQSKDAGETFLHQRYDILKQLFFDNLAITEEERKRLRKRGKSPKTIPEIL
jgi:hypothetical protein